MCLATIPNIRTYCTSCGHPLCKTCTCPLPKGAEEAHRAFEASGGVHLTIRDGDTLTSYNRSVPPSLTKESGDPMAVAGVGTGKQHTTRQAYERAAGTRLPALATTFFAKPRSLEKPCVRQNPFIVADRLTRSGPTSHSSQTARRGAAPSECVSHISDDEFHDAVCDVATCQATHPERQPYCPSISDAGSHSSFSTAETSTGTHELTDHGSSSGRPATVVHEQHRTETNEQEHKQPRHQSPARVSQPQEAHNHRRDKPPDCHYSAPHGHHVDDEYDVRTQESRPRKQPYSTPVRLHGQQVQPNSTSDRLRGIQTKSSPALAQLWLSPEPAEDFRSVRSNLRQSGPPSKPKLENKEQLEKEQGEARVRLSHYSPPPKTTSATKGPSEAEERLRKIRSEAQMTSAKTTEREEKSKKTIEKDKGGVPADLPAPNSVTFLAEEAPTEKQRRSTRDKSKSRKKGKEAVRESRPEPQPAAVPTKLPQTILQPPSVEVQDHQYDWRDKYSILRSEYEDAQLKSDDIGLEGLTIVLHLKGKDDLVINTDLSNLDAK